MSQMHRKYFHGRADHTVFDNGHRDRDVGTAMNTSSFKPFTYRRTERDRRPPRRVLTAFLMGDPKPGRSAQDQLEAVQRT